MDDQKMSQSIVSSSSLINSIRSNSQQTMEDASIIDNQQTRPSLVIRTEENQTATTNVIQTLNSALIGTTTVNTIKKSNSMNLSAGGFGVGKTIFSGKSIPARTATTLRLQPIATSAGLMNTSTPSNKTAATTSITSTNTLSVVTSGSGATKFTLKDLQARTNLKNLILDSKGSTVDSNKIVLDKNDLVRLKIIAPTSPVLQQQQPFPLYPGTSRPSMVTTVPVHYRGIVNRHTNPKAVSSVVVTGTASTANNLENDVQVKSKAEQSISQHRPLAVYGPAPSIAAAAAAAANDASSKNDVTSSIDLRNTTALQKLRTSIDEDGLTVNFVPKQIDPNPKMETDGKLTSKIVTVTNSDNSKQKETEIITISKPLKNKLEQQYIKIATSSGVGHMSRQMSDAMVEFHKWQKENDPENKMSKIDLNHKLKEIIERHRERFTALKKTRVPSDVPQKRKSSLTTFDEEDHSDSKKSNSSDSTSASVPILDNLGETREGRRNKPSEHDALYNLLRLDAADVLRKKRQQQQPTSSTLNIAASTTVSSSGQSQNVQILNGQLSDLSGPIRLLDKSTLLPKVAITETSTQNTQKAQTEMHAPFLSAGLTGKSKARKLLDSIDVHENLLKIFTKQDTKKSISNRTIERIKSSSRRTMGGRSKSLSSGSGRNAMKYRFKIGGVVYSKSKRIRKHLDQDWNSLTDVLSSSLQDGTAQHEVEKNDAKLNEKTFLKTKSLVPTPVESDESNSNELKMSTGLKFMAEIEQLLRWNSRNTAANLPKTSISFERNEFGMIEFRNEARKLDAIKMTKVDKNYPQLQPSMACGHSDSTACFNAIIKRIDKSAESCTINRKKPNQYFSNEFKELIGSLVQKNGNKCHAISVREIVDAIMETDKFERTKSSNNFNWSRFVNYYNSKVLHRQQIIMVTSEKFPNPFPNMPNTFEIGQKLEAIDPKNCGLFCVCTIVDKCGFRIKLRFDGYHSTYDFWVNADSVNIFPVGWCSKTARELEWPHRRLANTRETTFDWNDYLQQTNSVPAPRSCFTHLNAAMTNTNPFKIGMKLEADDMQFTRKICVATIGDVIDSRILVTFDGFDDSSNYWTDITSPYIHPVNWHNENGYSITTPPGKFISPLNCYFTHFDRRISTIRGIFDFVWNNILGWKFTPFKWDAYLRANRAECVPEQAFCTRNPILFTAGMALEVVDKKNSSLIRPAIVTMVDEYEIKILFIGWPEAYAYWLEDDSSNIHPPNWAKKTGHPIECPLDEIYNLPTNGCGIRGCRGIGNGKKPELNTHTTLEECPYELKNWQNDDRTNRPNRIDRKHKTVNKSFNVGAGPCRTRVSANPALEKPQVSLQPFLNPTELAAMSNKDVEIYRRLQVSANFLLENKNNLSKMRDQWINRVKPLQPVKLSAAAKNPLNWSKQEVGTFVAQLPNCSMLAPAFIEHEIDGMAFLSLRQKDMIDIMGLSLGSAIKVFNRIVYLREECNAHYIRY